MAPIEKTKMGWAVLLSGGVQNLACTSPCLQSLALLTEKGRGRGKGREVPLLDKGRTLCSYNILLMHI